MSFLKGVGKFLLGGVLGGGLLGNLFGKKKQPLGLPRPATRDDAAVIAERDAELAKRRGASADRITGASGEPAGGFGNLIRGS
jgi:hypothetical protein